MNGSRQSCRACCYALDVGDAGLGRRAAHGCRPVHRLHTFQDRRRSAVVRLGVAIGVIGRRTDVLAGKEASQYGSTAGRGRVERRGEGMDRRDRCTSPEKDARQRVVNGLETDLLVQIPEDRLDRVLPGTTPDWSLGPTERSSRSPPLDCWALLNPHSCSRSRAMPDQPLPHPSETRAARSTRSSREWSCRARSSRSEGRPVS